MGGAARVLDELSTPDFVLVELSEVNKRSLLQTSIPTNAEHARAESIRNNLERLNPEQRNKFALKARLATPDAPLRLYFTRDAEICNDTAATVKSYICISYCCHASEHEWKKAGKGKKLEPWPFERTFVESILRLRSSMNEGIWFDAGCIDQTDPEEKEKKTLIQAMNLLYGSARQIVIILEDVLITDEEGRFVETYWQRYATEYRKEGQDQQSQDPTSKDKPYMLFPGQTGWSLSQMPEEYIRHARTLFPKVMSARWFSRA